MAQAPPWNELRQRIRSEQLPELAKKILGDYESIVFLQDPAQLAQFQTYCIEAIGLNAGCEIAIVGSAHVGYSLGPENYGAPFSPNSDIDVAIIDPVTFNTVSRMLLAWRYPWHLRKELSVPSRNSMQVILENAFAGAIDPGGLRYYQLGAQRLIPATQGFNQKWFSALKQVPVPLLAKREVNARLYSSRWHLERYQEFGLSLVREALAQEEGAK